MNRPGRVTDAAVSALTGDPGLRVTSGPHETIAPKTRFRSHVLTIGLEDYYHAASFQHWIREETWYRFEDRLAGSTRSALDLLDRCGARATFFVNPWSVQSAPHLIREVADRGHEIACRGDHSASPHELGPERFREHAIRCREELEEVVGRRVLGFRMAGDRLRPGDLWMLDVLAECGYLYDSSIGPAIGTNAAKVLGAYHRHRAQLSHRAFQEVPISSMTVFGLEVPIAGGRSLRHFPPAWTRNAIEHWDRHRREPYVMYFRTWELDPGQPRINAGPAAARMWHYRNLERMPTLLENLLASYPFTTIAAHLGLESVRPSSLINGAKSLVNRIVPALKKDNSLVVEGSDANSVQPTPITVVIPCFNESPSLRYLNNTLRSLSETLSAKYAFRFLFVDDGSTDNTWSTLQELFGGRADCRVIRHEQNRGVARTIQTGLRQAETPIVCSMDCDCTYDPHELGSMIPLLTDGVDLVTASPYHPKGQVRNVPGWRLFLSKHLSRLYRLVLHQKLSTYTSCFRVYRKQTAETLQLRHSGFLGVAELLARTDLAGRRIVEYPTTLEVRVLGRSKMKVFWTIMGHLSLMTDLVRLRISGNSSFRGAGS